MTRYSKYTLLFGIALLLFGLVASLAGHLGWGIMTPIGATLLLAVSVFANGRIKR